MYLIDEVDGEEYASEINRFNSMDPETFPLLKPNHLTDGHWWLVYHDEIQEPVAFAGIVTNDPYPKVCYFKRCYVAPDHWGHGLQLRLMFVREVKARELGYTQIVSECAPDSYSIPNFRRAGFEQVQPEQPWGKPGAVYWSKML